MHYVYLLKDGNGKVVWVGESIRPKGRLWQHRSKKGRFTKQDITMTIVTEYVTRKEAWYHQVKLQEEHGLETDLDRTRRAGASMSDARKEHLKRISPLGAEATKRKWR